MFEKKDYENGLMELNNEAFVALFENKDAIESSNLCEKCSRQVLNEKNELDCPCWSSIVALGQDDKGNNIVVSCESFSND